MTPNNLVNMAYLKGLDAIAVCDHNAARNLPACKAIADARGLLFVPGIEVQSIEEVHVLCYFPSVARAMEFGEYIYAYLPAIDNTPDLFGEQIAMNEDDQPIYCEPKLLIQSVSLSIDTIVEQCRAFHGVAVPAHINRTSNSLIQNLGFIPESLQFTTLEVYESLPVHGVTLDDYHIIYNSDAHYLTDISERNHFINAYEQTVEGVLAYLSEKK